MSTDAMEHSVGTTPAPAAAFPMTRLLRWSIRRELWENRSIYMAPLATAGVVLFPMLLATLNRLNEATRLEIPEIQDNSLSLLTVVAAPIIGVSMLVAISYCLSALHSERRDRSILFWKSLPVSDLTTVLSKAGIPIVVLPLLAFIIALAAQLVMLAMAVPAGTVALSEVPLARMTAILLYLLVTSALWHAPLYAWLLLVSGWARRMAFLWAIAPMFALTLIEQIAFPTRYVPDMIAHRFGGGMQAAFTSNESGEGLPLLDPLKFISTPGLWIGLVIAAGLLGAAVWLRRYRQQI